MAEESEDARVGGDDVTTADAAPPPQRFLDRDWDVCIVLDACRFDRFAAVYDGYLKGELRRLQSPGSSTPEWAYRTFTDRHDLAYLSGNPFINGLGIPLNELKWGASCDYPWAANDHIATVIDVWRDGWDDDLGTVPPDALASAYREHDDAVADADRTVLHYMQPHAPYLDRGTSGKLTTVKEGIEASEDVDPDADPGLLGRAAEPLRRGFETAVEGSSLLQRAGLWVELDKRRVLRSGTRKAALHHYDRNLKLVLETVRELVPELAGDVVVTADHGEAFGEEGVWEHHIETPIPALLEVPWVEVEGVVD